jgi:signal transduction histidine kinase
VKLGIVICAPTGQDASLTADVLRSAGIESAICRQSSLLPGQLAPGAGALLVVEEVIAGAAMRPLADFIDVQPTWSDLPVLLLTHSGADSLGVQRAVEQLGNVTLLERPVRAIALIAAARSAIRARERQYMVRDADKRKDEFLATLAHELRNPLAPIRTSMGILQRPQIEPVEIAYVHAVVERQVSHLTRLVDDLLDVARITSGKVALKKEHITLESVVSHAVEISRSSIEAKQHRLEVLQPATRNLLHADHARLVQAVANLLINAAKFTPGPGQIGLKADVDGNTATFTVSDNGIGLEPACLARIFDLFAQTPVPGEAPTGLGIGLSLARQFAEMHGGTLHAASEGLCLGSEFILTLPVVVENDQPLMQDATTEACRMENLTAKKILVVDDNVDAADTLQALLCMDGFEVTTVYDGLAAVNAANTIEPDVVVMDIGMPGMDGYEAAQMIRTQPCGRRVRLIALTGWGQSGDKKRAGEAGFDHHLVKPVDYDMLVKCFRK